MRGAGWVPWACRGDVVGAVFRVGLRSVCSLTPLTFAGVCLLILATVVRVVVPRGFCLRVLAVE